MGIANALDVASNAGFLLAGLAGLWIALRPATCFEYAYERAPYAVFFAGVLLTALGSAWYHLAPDNERLFWDRLPMTIAFMALVTAQVGDRIDPRAGPTLLAPMLAIGFASVVYWRATERAGIGNVVPYGVLQAYAVVILLLIALWLPSRYTRGGDVYAVFGAYVVAKIAEVLDAPLYEMGHVVSGHTLKHLAAAVGGALVCRMLLRRTLDTARAAPSPARRVAS
ncbi:MAG: alkaline phytoceramidase [Myxococcota bacterium]|nr:alkaline phytoceramidase [Myxococcota bacterium]